jgi:NAD-dependent DNA ligase
MREFLEKASIAYFSGYPIISDSEFDALVKKYNYDQVGYQVTDGVPHMYRMYSLQKFFNLAEAPTNLIGLCS